MSSKSYRLSGRPSTDLQRLRTSSMSFISISTIADLYGETLPFILNTLMLLYSHLKVTNKFKRFIVNLNTIIMSRIVIVEDNPKYRAAAESFFDYIHESPVYSGHCDSARYHIS